MSAVYEACCSGSIGIFESPTGPECHFLRDEAACVLGLPKKRGHMNWLPRYPGTGKSLSLICSSLRWLHENPVHVDDEASGIGREEIDADLPQWVREHAIKEREKAREAALRREEERLERARQKLAQDKAERERERRSLKLGKGKSY